VATKICKDCKVEKDVDEFYIHPRDFRYIAYCNSCSRERVNKWNRENRERYNKRARNYRLATKIKLFAHYGGKCACCGENVLEFLTLDHKNGGGTNHRRGMSNHQIYLEVIRNNYPDEFQVLCYNCNCAIGHAGYCPHMNLQDFYKHETG